MSRAGKLAPKSGRRGWPVVKWLRYSSESCSGAFIGGSSPSRCQPQDVVPGEDVVGLEERAAGRSGSPGPLPARMKASVSPVGRKSPSGPAADAAKLGELAVEGLVPGEEDIEQLRPDVRRQRQHQRHPLGERRSVVRRKRA